MNANVILNDVFVKYGGVFSKKKHTNASVKLKNFFSTFFTRKFRYCHKCELDWMIWATKSNLCPICYLVDILRNSNFWLFDHLPSYFVCPPSPLHYYKIVKELLETGSQFLYQYFVWTL